MDDRRARPRRHVALLVETSNSYARGLLVGIRSYIAEGAAWSIYLSEHSRMETDLSWLEGWRGDGLIARIENEATARHIRDLGLPTVDVSTARLIPHLPGVGTDNDRIAQLALDHFTTHGLRNVAFCGDPGFAWAHERGARFAAHARAARLTPHELWIRPESTLAGNRARLAEWLARLPKPVGVFACYDILGQEILEACRIAGVAVPGDIALLGVDNDELICNLTSPPLSSIQPDTTRTGYLAAALLEDMMLGHSVGAGLRHVAPLRVVRRQSSDLLSVADPLVDKGIRFIHENTDRNVAVRAVQLHVGLSRRSLDDRFVRAVGLSTHAVITRMRMERLANLLIETDSTLPSLASRLGFSHAEHMGVAFKKFSGRSPGAFRRANRVSSLQ